MIQNIKRFYQSHKKIVRIISIYTLVIVLCTIIFIIIRASNNDDSIHEQPSKNPSGSNDNTALSIDKDSGSQAEPSGLTITNYTVLNKCVFSSERNYIKYAINKALIINQSTHNNQPLNQQQSIASNATNSDIYPVVAGGPYYQATIDDDKVFSDNISYECSFNLTTTDDRKIQVYFNRYGNRPSDVVCRP